jgi:acyl-ACP thioesterase
MSLPSNDSRTFVGARKVRLGDVDRQGRLRFDALVRYAQDISNDDTNDAVLAEDMTWVVRKTVVDTHVEATFREDLTFTTFCSGTGSRWADRRLIVRGDQGAVYEISTLWIFVTENGSPRRLTDQFTEIYGQGVTNTRVSARLTHPEVTVDAQVHQWPMRVVDYDTLDHANNAAYWAVVEQERPSHKPHFELPFRAELEYGGGIAADAAVEYRTGEADGSLMIWWFSDGDFVASSRIWSGQAE